MQVLLDADSVDRGLRRIAGEIAERTRGAERLILVGIRRGGVPLAKRLVDWMATLEQLKVPLGTVDITLYRDDAATALPTPRIGPSNLPMSIDGRESVRCGFAPKLSQQRLSSTRRWPLCLGVLIGPVAPVSTETPFSSVSSFPCGRSRDLR